MMKCEAMLKRFLYGPMRRNYRIAVDYGGERQDIDSKTNWDLINDHREKLELNYIYDSRQEEISSHFLVMIERKIIRKRKRWELVIRIEGRECLLKEGNTRLAFLKHIQGKNFILLLRKKEDYSLFFPSTALSSPQHSSQNDLNSVHSLIRYRLKHYAFIYTFLSIYLSFQEILKSYIRNTLLTIS